MLIRSLEGYPLRLLLSQAVDDGVSKKAKDRLVRRALGFMKKYARLNLSEDVQSLEALDSSYEALKELLYGQPEIVSGLGILVGDVSCQENGGRWIMPGQSKKIQHAPGLGPIIRLKKSNFYPRKLVLDWLVSGPRQSPLAKLENHYYITNAAAA